MKQKFSQEYNLRTTISIVHMWQYFHTEDGLSTWFADKVTIRNGIYEFFWDKTSQQAKLIQNTQHFSVRFHWLDDEEETSYFQFKLERDDITNVVTLTITDFAYPDEKEDAIYLWNTQLEKLRRTIGL
jgi:hypothetical protein